MDRPCHFVILFQSQFLKFHESIGGLNLRPILQNHSTLIIWLGPFGLKFPSSHSGTFSRQGEEANGVGKPAVWKMSSWLQKQQEELSMYQPWVGPQRPELPSQTFFALRCGVNYKGSEVLLWPRVSQTFFSGRSAEAKPNNRSGGMGIGFQVMRPPLSSSGRSHSLDISSPASIRM